MSYFDDLKSVVSTDSWSKIESQADYEVGLAKEMQLEYIGGNGSPEKMYYQQRFIFDGINEISNEFDSNSIKIHPHDLFSIFFRAKILVATTTEEEFIQRSGGFFAFERRDMYNIISWKNRGNGYDLLTKEAINSLESEIIERRLISGIHGFKISTHLEREFDSQQFLNQLFKDLGINVLFFLKNPTIEESKSFYGLNGFDKTFDSQEKINDFFCAPSISYGTLGTKAYSYRKSSTILANMLNFLRIFSFIKPAQIMFGEIDIPFLPPNGPVFIGSNSRGGYYWDQDKQDPWNKIPDGYIFTSFGFRALNNTWLDKRVHDNMRLFFESNLTILKYIVHETWSKTTIKVIYPVIDLINSATQITDLGAKLLLIYCSLEHLFVPEGKNKENDKYILGGINALDSTLVPWFNELYTQRNNYAHKGYIINDKDNKGLSFIQLSMENVVTLLRHKISIIKK